MLLVYYFPPASWAGKIKHKWLAGGNRKVDVAFAEILTKRCRFTYDILHSFFCSRTIFNSVKTIFGSFNLKIDSSVNLLAESQKHFILQSQNRFIFQFQNRINISSFNLQFRVRNLVGDLKPDIRGRICSHLIWFSIDDVGGRINEKRFFYSYWSPTVPPFYIT